MKILNVHDFHRPADGVNWTPAVRRALAHAATCADGATLTFPTATYHFYEEGCAREVYYPCNNDGGEKAIVFHLKELHNLTIDGEESHFIFHGRVSPFIADGCRNLTVRRLSADTANPFFIQGVITASGPDFVELDVDKTVFPHRTEGRNLIIEGESWEHDIGDWWVLAQEFDGTTRAPAPDSQVAVAKIGEGDFDMSSLPAQLWTLSAGMTENGHLRLQGNFSYTLRVGNVLIITHEKRDHSFAYLKECAEVTLEDLTVHHAQAMGIIAQCTHNLTVTGCRYEVKENSGRLISLNADGVHCVNCTGLVQVTDCVMDGMMDDGINVHGLYSTVDTVEGKVVSLRHIHFQQHGVNVYFPGDEVVFLTPDTLQEVGTATVESATLRGTTHMVLTLHELPDVATLRGLITENRNRMPDVLIARNRFGRNRPRGVLMNSPKHVVIRDNVFYTSSSAIQFKGGPWFWGESGAVCDVLIEGNLFDDCGYADRSATIVMDQVLEHRDHGVPYHRNLTVRGNTFRQFSNRMASFRLLKGLTMVENTFIKTDTYADSGNDSQIILHDTYDVVTDIPETAIEKRGRNL